MRTFPTPPYPSTHQPDEREPSRRGGEQWGRAPDIPKLFVADGSVFTTGAAENPTLTIVALAIRQADRIAGEMSRGNL